MNETTTIMLGRPENRVIVAGASYWFFAFLVLPFFVTLLTADGLGSQSLVLRIETAYHICNFLAVVICFFPYLKESFWNVRLNFKSALRTAALCAAAARVLAGMGRSASRMNT